MANSLGSNLALREMMQFSQVLDTLRGRVCLLYVEKAQLEDLKAMEGVEIKLHLSRFKQNDLSDHEPWKNRANLSVFYLLSLNASSAIRFFTFHSMGNRRKSSFVSFSSKQI